MVVPAAQQTGKRTRTIQFICPGKSGRSMLRPCREFCCFVLEDVLRLIAADRLGEHDAVPPPEASQFLIIYRGATGFVAWDLDADYRAVVARAPFDAFRRPAVNLCCL